MSVPVPNSVLEWDDEQQQAAFAQLHVLNFIRSKAPHRDCPKCQQPPTLILSEEPGPGPDEYRRIVRANPDPRTGRECHTFFYWLPKLKNKDRRSSRSTGLAASSFCQCCRKTGVNLVGHHVIEVAEGGGDEPENVWTICEPCHRIVHALRRLAGGA